MKKQSKPKHRKQTMRRLFSYLLKRPVPLVFIVLLVVWSGFTNGYGIYVMREIIDKSILDFDINGLNKSLIKLAILFGSGALSALIYNPMMVKYSQTVIADIRNELFAHSQKLPLSYFDRTPRGEIMNYFTNDVDTLNLALNTGFTTIIYSVVTGIGTIVFLFLINFYLSLIVVFFIVVMFLWYCVIVKNAGWFC